MYTKLRAAESSNFILKYFGSFDRQGTGIIILEFAEEGNLASWFHKMDPIAEQADKALFWHSFFGMLQGLNAIHTLKSTDKRTKYSLRG